MLEQISGGSSMSLSIEERLRMIEDERAVLHTLYTYGHAIDYGWEEEFVNLWVESGELYWPGCGTMKGREEIRVAFRAHTHAPEYYHKHMVMSPLIKINGDQALADSMYLRVDAAPDSLRIVAFGRYRDVLSHCDDGSWRFISRRAESEGLRTVGIPFVTKADFGEPVEPCFTLPTENQRGNAI